MIHPKLMDCIWHLNRIDRGCMGALMGECDWLVEIMMIVECRA